MSQRRKWRKAWDYIADAFIWGLTGVVFAGVLLFVVNVVLSMIEMVYK